MIAASQQPETDRSSSLRLIRSTILMAGAEPQRWRLAFLGAAETQVRWTAQG